MKKQDRDQLKQLTVAELRKRLEEAEQSEVETKLKIQTNQTKDVMAVGRKRQEMARLKTYIRLAEASS